MTMGFISSGRAALGTVQEVPLQEDHQQEVSVLKEEGNNTSAALTANVSSSNDSSSQVTSNESTSPASNEFSSSLSPAVEKPSSQSPTEAATTVTKKESFDSSALKSCTIVTSSSVALSADVTADGEVTMSEDFSKRLVAQVCRKLDAFLETSPSIKENSNLESLPRFARDGLLLGNIIAKGGFSKIIEVNFTENNSSNHVPGLFNDSTSNNLLSNDKKEQQQYVIKSLSTMLDLKKLPGATKDIVFEAHTLSSLNHKNIIKLRGLSKDGIDGFKTTRRADGFFMVLDRLGDTLFQKVYQWQHELQYNGKYQGLQKKVSVRQIKREQFREKISIIVDVSAALAYCHSRRIVHRDIKSANVAYCPRDSCWKLIDFGLAMELPALDPRDPHRTYELTGNIGTARYMDPAVILSLNYNEKADVHSFSVLCWEACAGKKPYSKLDAAKVKERVSKWHERPKVYWSWPRKLKNLLRKGWAVKSEDRPAMQEFHKILVKVQKSLPKSNIDPALLCRQHN